MTARPFRVICQTTTPTTLSYLSEWYPSWEAGADAVLAHRTNKEESWDSIELVMPGQIPNASITGKQVLAVGAMGPRRRRHSTKKGA